MAREEAGRRNAAAKPAKVAKPAKEPYVPYVADDEEDDASSTDATPGADEHTARDLVFPAHEKED
jgi:hypothetical protein